MNDVVEELARGEFNLALPKLREACRRKYSSAELPPGKRFPSFVFNQLPPSDPEGEEDLFALAMWEAPNNSKLAEDVLLLERAVLLHSDLHFSTLAAWLALRTRPGLPRVEMDEGKRLVEMYLAPCLKAYEVDGVNSAGEMYVRLVEILVTSEALGVEEALGFLKANKATKLDLVGLLEDRVKLRLKPVPLPAIAPAVSPAAAAAAAAAVASPAVNSAEGAEEVPKMVEEFQRLHPTPQLPPRQTPPLLLDKQQALLMAGGFSSLLLLFVLLRFRQKITSSVLSLGDLVFGQ
ncbi:hypothetical protein BASA81_005764 [Batrachochytrium salamandrivorans]|nr:hypothetical protein BASA81_005764 [Batrachochytrium salamandrivorans]